MLVDQRLVDQILDEIRVSRQISEQLRKQLASDDECCDDHVHDEGIEPPQTAV
jgi:hypothetical protein